MLLCIISPFSVVERIESVTKRIPQLETLFCPYKSIAEAPRLVAENQSKVEGVLFSGSLPYYRAANELQPAVPWFYLPNPACGLSFAFLKARAMIKDEVSFSIDTLFDEDVQDSISDFDFSIRSVYNYPYRPLEQIKDIVAFHLSHFRSGLTTFCMTCVNEVYQELARLNAPVFFVFQAPFTIRKILISSMQTLNSPNVNNLKLVVGLFQMEQLLSQPAIHESSICAARKFFSTYDEKRDILIFQSDTSTFQSVQAYNHFILETNNFAKIPILEQFKSAVPGFKIRIGYGVASNIKLAQMYAEKALEMARDKEGDNAYLFDGNNGWRTGEMQPSLFLSSRQNASFHALSQKIGITSATLSRYFQALRTLDAPFSAFELSHVLGLQPKSVRKILALFLKTDIVTIESSRAPLHKGRPEFLYRCTSMVKSYEIIAS